LAFDDFRSLAEHLLGSCRADMFLSSPGFPGHDNYYIAIDPTDELQITEETDKDDISRFAFSDPRPVFGFLSYPFGVNLRGVASDKCAYVPTGMARKYKYYFNYNAGDKMLEILSDVDDIPAVLLRGLTVKGESREFVPAGANEIKQSLEREEYIERVKRTLKYIRDGYIYQLNLSLKYSARIPDFDARRFFLHLWRTFPAPFYAWFDCGRYQLFSTSPERFLKVEQGRVRSEPIKGTLAFRDYSPALMEKLTGSAKESAELSMIVDMVRNDIAQNCDYGSVRVEGHKSVFAVDNLLQMYTLVTGTLTRGKSCLDLLLDAFPGASVTGCPKKKAIEIIDEVEPHPRDIYCGTFFRIEDKAAMDASITIRTGYYDEGEDQLHFFAGSGIVADSIPEKEYAETVDKAEKFLRTLR